ncbi:uncharacterized protein LOC130825558 [Amaranthus tricolor]|uniref:uncharacterized protein LOC130825558 n=1 Tax=Amaranthus tricolor TaxID=29722 RepID=UPI00258CB9DF|nr:uncharacterized protein LOC130825558 [Amaranthus tricolor]
MMEGNFVSYKSMTKRNILAILFVLVLVQNMGGKALAKDCNLPGDYCTAFGGCCPGYYCSRDKNTCVEYPNPSCKKSGQNCGGFQGSCCGRMDCYRSWSLFKGVTAGNLLGGTCQKE